MITSLSITGFKGLKDFSVDGLCRVTVFGGANAVGKTTLLEAIFLFFDRANPALLLRQFQWRGQTAFAVVPEQMFAPAFYDYDMQERIVIEATIDGKRERLCLSFGPPCEKESVAVGEAPAPEDLAAQQSANGQSANGGLELKYQPPDGEEQLAHLLLGEDKVKIEKPQGFTRDERNAVFLATRVNLGPAPDARRFSDLDVAGEAQSAVEFIRNFDPRITDISVVPHGMTPVLYADIGLSQKIPVAYLGDGASRLLSIFLAMTWARGGVILIDEIGSGLHHSILGKMWREVAKAAHKYDCQVVATSHSYECIRAVQEGLEGLVEPDFAYARMQQTKEGLVARVFPFEAFVAAIEKGWEIR